uniref:FLYWCH-type domain-containing protein n=1 Tax=Panagrolaimus sp. ES5 TaxID=591445 RepID=A0AC34G8S3_9BILA
MGSNQSSPENVVECPSNSTETRSLLTDNGQSDIPINDNRAMSNLVINDNDPASIKDAPSVPQIRIEKKPNKDVLFIGKHRFDPGHQNKGDKQKRWQCQFQRKYSCSGTVYTTENGELIMEKSNWNHTCGFTLDHNALDAITTKSEELEPIRPPRSQSLGPSSNTKSSTNASLKTSLSGSNNSNINSHNKVEAYQNLNAANVGSITHSPRSYKSETQINKYVINI